MGKYILGIITALIFVAAAVVWFSQPGNLPEAGVETPTEETAPVGENS